MRWISEAEGLVAEGYVEKVQQNAGCSKEVPEMDGKGSEKSQNMSKLLRSAPKTCLTHGASAPMVRQAKIAWFGCSLFR